MPERHQHIHGDVARSVVYTHAMTVLLADVGGTNTRCAIGDAAGMPGDVATYRNDDFASLDAVLARYLDSLPADKRPRTGVVAIAAPLRGEDVRMTSRAWSFSREGLRQALGLLRLELINDFAAQAWALPVLGPGDLVKIGGGNALDTAPRVVLGPGTGLGAATLVRAPDGGWMALPGEGGHVTLAAQDAREEDVIRSTRERFGHCSAERLLSGPGLTVLHDALHGVADQAPEQLGSALLAGDAAAEATFGMFFRLLATVAGDLALTLGAFGGVYISGGIVPRYIDALQRSDFRQRFEAKGRYRDYMRAVPVWAITSRNPALAGALALARVRGLA